MTVIHKSSGDLKPGIDLPECGVDVVVTELVDSGLLGERIVPVLTDARVRGLLAEGGRVIPEVRACGAVKPLPNPHGITIQGRQLFVLEKIRLRCDRPPRSSPPPALTLHGLTRVRTGKGEC